MPRFKLSIDNLSRADAQRIADKHNEIVAGYSQDPDKAFTWNFIATGTALQAHALQETAWLYNDGEHVGMTRIKD